jgi:CspA family cold shock protein
MAPLLSRHRSATVGSHLEEVVMPTGTVRWFNTQKGFGFIAQDGGGPDAFVHVSAVGLRGLEEGQKLQYDLVADPRKGKAAAENLKTL